MARRAIRVAVIGAVLGAAGWVIGSAGCSNTPAPLPEAKPVETTPPPKTLAEIAPGGKPEKSDPAAVAVIDEAIKAHTGGNRDLLRPLRSFTQTRTGQLRFGGPDMIPQSWVVHAAWPDRFRLKADLPGSQTIILAWSGDGGWRSAGAGSKAPMTAQEVQDFRVDVTGEWLGLLVPLAEPDTVVAPATEATVNGKPAAGVRVWNPHLSDAVAHFDKETKRLALITFEGREGGRKVTKEVLVLSYKPFLGVALPEKVVVKSNGNPLAEWTMTGLEAVPSLDPKLFENP